MIISYFFPPEFDRDSSSVANSRVTSVLTVHPDSQLTASSGCINININVQIYYRKIKHLLLHGGEFCCFRSIKNISSLMSVRVRVIIKVLSYCNVRFSVIANLITCLLEARTVLTPWEKK